MTQLLHLLHMVACAVAFAVAVMAGYELAGLNTRAKR